ncbi:hypothetical protein B0H66DRAFT_636260 [Apodospora peruviana]|uniref:Uncharacterized protein n=1 Tax=Apodospora peruviana TaxID=516989 RepID=A0AAE0IUL1_9PEZI|nr:hypothetical protein B0H66DRAFT_636260 [Apodospora peruviana]
MGTWRTRLEIYISTKPPVRLESTTSIILISSHRSSAYLPTSSHKTPPSKMVAITLYAALAGLLGAASAMPTAVTAPQVLTREANDALLRYLTEIDPSTIQENPVPGMPSLADLNITMADFFDPGFRAEHGLADPRHNSYVPPAEVEDKRDVLQKRYDPVCFGVDQVVWDPVAYACRDYLNSLGGGIVFCSRTIVDASYGTQTGYVRGIPFNVQKATSYCRDVASGMNWIINSCKPNNPCRCASAGRNAATGNGNLVVELKKN